MIRIHSKEIASIMAKEAAAYSKVVKEAAKHCDSITSLEAMVHNPTAYCAEMLPKAAHDLELPLAKLFELYSTPVAKITALASQLESEYMLFIAEGEDGIYLDQKQVENHIKKVAVHELTAEKELVYQTTTKVCSELNKLQKKLKESGKSPLQLGQYLRADYKGEWSPNTALILTLGF